jgi:hypothetical protein
LGCSHHAHPKPQQLVPSFGRKAYESTAVITTHLIYPGNNLDPNFVLVAHHIMTHFSMKAGLKQFKQHSKEAVF